MQDVGPRIGAEPVVAADRPRDRRFIERPRPAVSGIPVLGSRTGRFQGNSPATWLSGRICPITADGDISTNQAISAGDAMYGATEPVACESGSYRTSCLRHIARHDDAKPARIQSGAGARRDVKLRTDQRRHCGSPKSGPTRAFDFEPLGRPTIAPRFIVGKMGDRAPRVPAGTTEFWLPALQRVCRPCRGLTIIFAFAPNDESLGYSLSPGGLRN